MKDRIYDTMIIGGGASGLYAAAHSARQRGLILEKEKAVGTKLLMTGAGQCNLTHGGDIKDFVNHYGDNGKRIRGVLYKHSNREVISYFEEKGMPLIEREDGKVFPASLRAEDIRRLLLDEARKRGFEVRKEEATDISYIYDERMPLYRVACGESAYSCRKLIIATGGCSYPATGSDGGMFDILERLGIELVPRRPALTPISVHEYPYAELSGVSFEDAEVRCGKRSVRDALLFTHRNLSGPAILNISRWVSQGDEISVNYLPDRKDLLSHLKKIQAGHAKQAATALSELDGRIPRRFAEIVLRRADIAADRKFASLTGEELKRVAALLTADVFAVTGTGSYHTAMVTAGGISLNEIRLPPMEFKKYPRMYAIGEVLDIDGDTGGYNLQFAFSSAYLAARHTHS